MGHYADIIISHWVPIVKRGIKILMSKIFKKSVDYWVPIYYNIIQIKVFIKYFLRGNNYDIKQSNGVIFKQRKGYSL